MKSTTTHVSIKPTTDFDQRFYYCSGERQNVWGYRLGLLVNNAFKVGIGGYYMNASKEVIAGANALSATGTSSYSNHKKLYLGTIYYEPYLLRRQLWELSAVFETGYGRTVNYQLADDTHSMTTYNNLLILPAGAGLSVNFKLPPFFHLQGFRWLGVNLMAGYRTAVYQEDRHYDYDGAYWSVSGAIFLDRLLDDLQQWKKDRAVAKQKKAVELHF
ncbi:MAG TPA: hypothetical protein VL307_10315 [Chitinophagaceae bacterium]|nr:hypothetical protein [Chitinophagaceae bacterium]